MKNKISQKEKVLNYIKEFGSITQLEAFRDLAIFRLASRISDLRKDGYKISSKFETVKNRYGECCPIKRYYLDQDAPNCNIFLK